MRPWLLVGLAPLLGASDLLIKTLGLSLVALPLLVLLGAFAKARPLTLLLVACALLSLADLLLQAFALELRDALGIFLPLLLVTLIQAPANWREGLQQGALFSGVALLLGTLRETLGSGTLLHHADWLFGSSAAGWTLHVPGFNGLHLFALVPGAFILLGVLWAAARSVSTNPSTDSDTR